MEVSIKRYLVFPQFTSMKLHYKDKMSQTKTWVIFINLRNLAQHCKSCCVILLDFQDQFDVHQIYFKSLNGVSEKFKFKVSSIWWIKMSQNCSGVVFSFEYWENLSRVTLKKFETNKVSWINQNLDGKFSTWNKPRRNGSKLELVSFSFN